MTFESLPLMITLLIALSVASERVVEIVKGLVPFLSEENSDKKLECRRRSALQGLAILAGILISWASWPVLRGIIPETQGRQVPIDPLMVLALGLLASGGSGFWNSMLGYVSSMKELKRTELQERSARDTSPSILQPVEGELKP